MSLVQCLTGFEGNFFRTVFFASNFDYALFLPRQPEKEDKTPAYRFSSLASRWIFALRYLRNVQLGSVFGYSVCFACGFRESVLR